MTEDKDLQDRETISYRHASRCTALANQNAVTGSMNRATRKLPMKEARRLFTMIEKRANEFLLGEGSGTRQGETNQGLTKSDNHLGQAGLLALIEPLSLSPQLVGWVNMTRC